MGSLAILALRIVLVTCLAGSLVVQGVLVLDLVDVPWQLATVIVLGIVTAQVSGACVWKLLTMVRCRTVFSDRAFRYVDAVFVALSAASLLTFLLAVALAPGSVAPGVVFLICGMALVIAGMALLVLVMRMLLAQAVARDTEAQHMQAELNEVI